MSTAGGEISIWNVNVNENPVQLPTTLSKQTLIERQELRERLVNVAILVYLKRKQVLEPMAPAPIILTVGRVLRVLRLLPRELERKVVEVQTVRTATLCSGPSIPLSHRNRFLLKEVEAVKEVKVVQGASPQSEDKAAMAGRRLFALVLNIQEMGGQGDQAVKAARVVGVV